MDAVDARRNRMQVRVYSSLAAQDRDDAAYWAALPVDVRVLQVWKLSEAQWRLNGEWPDESGLPRSVIGHLNEHYGNLATYFRIKGIVPPSSRR